LSRRAFSLIGILLSLALLVGALGLFYSAYRRVETQVRLMGDAWATRGVVLEKLVEESEDRLLPWDVTTYVVRYAYPNDRGQMRTGEQVVTRRFFEQTPEQGEPIPVVILTDDSAVTAVSPGLTFPAGAGWRVGLALVAVLGSMVLSTISLALTRRDEAEG